MKNKNQKSHIRSIKSTTLIPDLASYVSEQCACYCEASRRIGLFPSQEKYYGHRLFAVYLNMTFIMAFRTYSAAQDFVRRNNSKNCSYDIVLFQAK